MGIQQVCIREQDNASSGHNDLRPAGGPIPFDRMNRQEKEIAPASCMSIEAAGTMLSSTIMKSYREELWFETKTRRAYINITPHVEAAVKKSGIREGLILVNAMHITASVYINDDECGLLQDYDDFLERLAPQEAVYRHNDTGEDNGDAHLKRQVMGREVVVALTGGKLDFGPWERIFYGEFDGRRRKRVLVKIIGE